MDGRSEHQLITRLHEVAAGRLAPAAAAVPLRLLLAGSGVRLHRAWVEAVDLERGRVATSTGLLEYDTLVLAPGSQTDHRARARRSGANTPAPHARGCAPPAREDLNARSAGKPYGRFGKRVRIDNSGSRRWLHWDRADGRAGGVGTGAGLSDWSA